MLSFKCPSCGKPYSVPDSQSGARARCRHCRASFVVPPPAGTGPPPPPSDVANASKVPTDRPPQVSSVFMPPFFQTTNAAGAFLLRAGVTASAIAALACLAATLHAFNTKGGEVVAAGFLVAGVVCLVGVPASVFVVGTGRVVVDVAQNVRAMRAKQEVGAGG